MPDTAFDCWTRRRFGQVAGALITLPLLAGAASPAAAKHHRKKKKKKRNAQGCLDPADGECEPNGGFCNPHGSACCDCLKCLSHGHEDVVIYQCG